MSPVTLFFLQLTCILIVCRVAGRVMALVGQPKVIGEMLAGIVLGPSLLGLIAPSTESMLFPASSLGALSLVSQLGIVLYMFVVGMEIQVDFLRQAYKEALLVSVTGIVVPFAMGAAFAVYRHEDGRFFGPSMATWQSMVYLGAAMAVTAFPVLARIIQERGIAGTKLGTLALAAGASDDAIAWCLLAIVLAGLDRDPRIAGMAIAGGAVYAGVVLGVLRRWLASYGAEIMRRGSLQAIDLGLVLALLMAGAWFTDIIGIHAVFGAFVLGVAIPRGGIARELAARIEPLAAGLLIPLFFVYSGLSTRMALIASPSLIVLTIVVIAIASISKGAGCWAAAVFAGRSVRAGFALGALMNARGLMELIILNIGLERGLITPMLFTIMVAMTICTTLAAGPLFEWAWRGHSVAEPVGSMAARPSQK